MTVTLEPPTTPDRQAVTAATEAWPHVDAYLTRHQDADEIRLVVADEQDAETLTVPRSAVELLAIILKHMAAGEGVRVVPSHAELTTQQAADLLNVSRPYLIGLLDDGKISYRKVGKHRRVKMASVMEYLGQDNVQRAAAADELAALTQEMGLV